MPLIKARALSSEGDACLPHHDRGVKRDVERGDVAGLWRNGPETGDVTGYGRVPGRARLVSDSME